MLSEKQGYLAWPRIGPKFNLHHLQKISTRFKMAVLTPKSGISLPASKICKKIKVQRQVILKMSCISFQPESTSEVNSLFHSSFVRKSVFHGKNIQYAYNFYGTELYVNICRGIFRTQSNIFGGTYLQKSQESFIVDVRLGSKYASGIGLTVGQVYRMSIFI